MVKTLKYILLFGILAALPVRAEFQSPHGPAILKMEFSKPEIYPGEYVTVSYVLYSFQDFLDVEVAKFPEFRGYWSENLSLRQGPIPLLPDFRVSNTQINKAVIGSYLLTPMIDNSAPSIRPMKLVVRDERGPNRSEEESRDILLISEGSELKILPLPTPPEEMAKEFQGAVGKFTVHIERPELFYRPNEPITLRYFLQGEGNFHEINELPIAFPKNVEVLSTLVTTQGAGQFQSKTFNVTLTVNGEGEIVVPPSRFVYFNVTDRNYESIEIRTLKLVPDPAELGNGEDQVWQLPEPHPKWFAFRPWHQQRAFIIPQALGLACILLFFLARIWNRLLAKVHSRGSSKRWLRRTHNMEDAWQAGNIEGFLYLADEILFDYLKRALPTRRDHTPTREEILAVAPVDEPTRKRIRDIMEAHHHLRYSPEKRLPEDSEALHQAVQKVLGQTGK